MRPSLAKIYRNTGTYATPTWQELKAVVDSTINASQEQIDATRRGDAFTGTVPGSIDLSVEVTCLWDPADATLNAIWTAAKTGAQIELLITDKPVTMSGAQGPRGFWYVYGWTHNQSRTEAQRVSFTLRPAADATEPMTWFTVP